MSIPSSDDAELAARKKLREEGLESLSDAEKRSIRLTAVPMQRSADGEHGLAGHGAADLGCAVCSKTGVSLFRCSKCKRSRRVCSRECFAELWKSSHKEECKMLRKIADLSASHAKQGKLAEALNALCKQAKGAEAAKQAGNALLKEGKNFEAIAKYASAVSCAVCVEHGIRSIRRAGRRAATDSAAKPGEEDSEEDEDQHSSSGAAGEAERIALRRSRETGERMRRLAAIASVNTCVAYTREGKAYSSVEARPLYAKAHDAAREALTLDPTYHYKALPRMMQAIQQAGRFDEDAIMWLQRCEMMQKTMHMGEPVALLMSDLVSNARYYRLERARFRV